MRDISERIQRYRLARYAAPEQDRVDRRLRWVSLIAALWLAWVGFLSDHSYYRIWQLSRQRTEAEAELARTTTEVRQLDQALRDPAAQLDVAERALREKNGMAKKGEIVYVIRPDGGVAR